MRRMKYAQIKYNFSYMLMLLRILLTSDFVNRQTIKTLHIGKKKVKKKKKSRTILIKATIKRIFIIISKTKFSCIEEHEEIRKIFMLLARNRK